MLQKPSSPDFIIIKTSSQNTTAIPKEYRNIANMNQVKDAMLWRNVNNPLYMPMLS